MQLSKKTLLQSVTFPGSKMPFDPPLSHGLICKMAWCHSTNQSKLLFVREIYTIMLCNIIRNRRSSKGKGKNDQQKLSSFQYTVAVADAER